MKLILAPMEGVADAPLRHLLTSFAGFDQCVSEFIRITDSLLSEKYFLQRIPELRNASCTASKVPIVVQLLGSDALCLAENAARVVEFGALAIDLNFGCPAPKVNKHHGGAALLDQPDLIWQLVSLVRKAVPAHVPLSAKMRLGISNTNKALACAQAISSAGASCLTVHARTKDEAYRVPAHWEWIAKIREAINIPVIANGEVWSLADYREIRQVSGCEDVMLGRGVLANPGLARQISLFNNGVFVPDFTWQEVHKLILQYFASCRVLAPNGHYAVSRLKQWLRLLPRQYPEANQLFAAIRSLSSQEQIAQLIIRGSISKATP